MVAVKTDAYPSTSAAATAKPRDRTDGLLGDAAPRSYPTAIPRPAWFNEERGLSSSLARHLAGLLLAVCALPFGAQAAAPQPTHEFTLDNGLKVIVREDHRAPVVVSQIWYCLLYTSDAADE